MARDDYLRVICYDIEDDRRRRRIARLLEDRASRVQYSVFEARLATKALVRLIRRLEPHLADNDSLRVYTIGRSGERTCQVIGAGVAIEPDGAF